MNRLDRPMGYVYVSLSSKISRNNDFLFFMLKLFDLQRQLLWECAHDIRDTMLEETNG